MESRSGGLLEGNGRGADRLALQHLGIGLALLVALTVAGTFGFVFLAEMTWIEGLYMTVTTLSTVGYGEVRPLDDASRLFASGLIVVGVGAALYTAGAMAEFLIAGRIRDVFGRRSMSRKLASLEDHVIVCGYGRLGAVVVEELFRSGLEPLVIDPDPAVAERLRDSPHTVLTASAEEEGVLERAGIERAAALVAATASEAVNVYVALAAREANPEIAVHARAESDAGARRLRRAGAHQVVLPHTLGGRRLANAILRPAMVDFLEISRGGRAPRVVLEEVRVHPRSPLCGVRLRGLPELDLAISVVVIQRRGEEAIVRPGADDALAPGDRVVVVGDPLNVQRIEALAGEPG